MDWRMTSPIGWPKLHIDCDRPTVARVTCATGRVSARSAARALRRFTEARERLSSGPSLLVLGLTDI
jgi:hypothetical protein